MRYILVITMLSFVPQKVYAGNNDCYASQNLMSVYNDFRSKYPFHYQTVGLAEYIDNSCMFLISEPTPDVSEQSIRHLFSQYDYSLLVLKHKLGYDGYIKDILIVVRSVSHDQILQLESKIHKLLFSTNYKAEKTTLRLPVDSRRKYFTDKSLNYQVSIAELNDWFIINNELFEISQNQKLSIKKILNSSISGVFFSENPGLVAWVINKDENLAQKKSDIRKFSLDADIVLGAFSNTKKLIIIGRERECKLYELPPLCTETILMLASCQQPQLSQSLDILDVLAGRIQNRKYDWCPTYLSDELENTEFGDLLTINDLLLKGWSEHGEMQIKDINYPSPARYPFKKPLSDIMKDKQNVTTIVYNWNTNDAVYSLKTPNYSMYAISNTGALPISYFNDQYSGLSLGKQYEAQAYHYFAGINNTDLARSVQYFFLFSIFLDNNIYSHTSNSTNKTRSKKPYLLEENIRTLLTNIKDASSMDIFNISDDIAVLFVNSQWKDSIEIQRINMQKEFNEWVKKEIEEKELDESDPVIIEQINDLRNKNENEFNKQINKRIKEETETWRNYLRQCLQNVQLSLRSMTKYEYNQCCKYLSYPRGIEVAPWGEDHKIRNIINEIHHATSLVCIHKDLYKPFGVDLGDVMDFFSRKLSSESAAWIKTPTLIRSYRGAFFVGGHNLIANVNRVSSMTEYNPVFGERNNTSVPRRRENVIPVIHREHRGL